MKIKKRHSKFRVISLFSVFSLSWLIVVALIVFLMLSIYWHLIDPKSKMAHIANEIISNKLGIPIEELEELERKDEVNGLQELDPCQKPLPEEPIDLILNCSFFPNPVIYCAPSQAYPQFLGVKRPNYWLLLS